MEITNSISRKLLKVGLFSLGIVMMFKTNIFATSPTDINFTNEFYSYFGAPVRLFDIALSIVQIVSLIIAVATGLSILITKIKAKKQPELKKVKKWVKILFIISLIVFILSILSEPIIYNLEVIIKN